MQINNHSCDNVWTRYTETLGVIFRIYMQFAFKWDQPILCSNNVFIFWKFFDDATDVACATHHQKLCPTLGESTFWRSYTPNNIKWNRNPYEINVKFTLSANISYSWEYWSQMDSLIVKPLCYKNHFITWPSFFLHIWRKRVSFQAVHAKCCFTEDSHTFTLEH